MGQRDGSDADDDEPEYDESDVRVRPNRKGNRPRTKTRPEHDDAVTGRVLTVDRGRYTVLLDEGTPDERQSPPPAPASCASKSSSPATASTSSATPPATRARSPASCASSPASTLLRRSADDTDEVERIIVANADQMLIVVAAANPEPRIRLVDRYLVAAFDAGIDADPRASPRPTSPTRPSSSRTSPGSTSRSSEPAPTQMPLDEITRRARRPRHRLRRPLRASASRRS